MSSTSIIHIHPLEIRSVLEPFVGQRIGGKPTLSRRAVDVFCDIRDRLGEPYGEEGTAYRDADVRGVADTGFSRFSYSDAHEIPYAGINRLVVRSAYSDFPVMEGSVEYRVVR